MEQIQVEIGYYREIKNSKGAWKGTFSIIIHPMGQKIIDCKYFVQGDNRWFTFPQKEIKKAEGEKSDYISLVSYVNKEYLDQLKLSVLEALKNVKPEANNVQAQNQSYQRQKNYVQAQPSFNYGQPPF